MKKKSAVYFAGYYDKRDADVHEAVMKDLRSMSPKEIVEMVRRAARTKKDSP